MKDASTAIESLSYNGHDAVMSVLFVTGQQYDYFNVPRSVAKNVLSADSQGKAFHKHIRGQYSYERCREGCTLAR